MSNDEYSDLEYATRLDGTTMPAPKVLPNEHCWCGGEVGSRVPGDHLGLGCLANISHNWNACSAESQRIIEGDDPRPPRPMRDRGRETSNALVAVRTVLSRAETALSNMEFGEFAPIDYEGNEDRDSATGERLMFLDEDYDEMRAALEHVVETLEWWRRTGRPRRST